MMNNYNYQVDANISSFIEDDDYEERKSFFLNFLKTLQEADIKYGVACSFNLFLRGIVDEFHDFDLIVDIEDIPTLKEIMERLGAILVSTGGNGFCESNVYLHYQVGRIDLDIISGFRILTFGTSFIYEYNSSEIETIKIYEEEEIVIPIISAEAMFLLYCMMEGWQPRRRYKRILLGEYLETHMKFPEILKESLEKNLPGWIKREARKLLQS